ncbi:MAG: Asp-tRNA(Asn)/Glu-tRNA(Gln) amidotransferase subunit GatC [Bacteroidetes bacterium]|nr:Asp-tRNA(Asn)/Glu-tRNA(Gln) amidotransferase subunit GatC [Bacteroidota bacterium]
MKITDEMLNHIAHLARLEFIGEEKQEIKQDMEKIINFMDALNSIDTSGVEPLIFMSDEVNVLREDVTDETISKNEALKNAPKKDSDYIRIPKVLNK